MPTQNVKIQNHREIDVQPINKVREIFPDACSLEDELTRNKTTVNRLMTNTDRTT